MLWSGLSWVIGSPRVNLIVPFPLGRNYLRKVTMNYELNHTGIRKQTKAMRNPLFHQYCQLVLSVVRRAISVAVCRIEIQLGVLNVLKI